MVTDIPQIEVESYGLFLVILRVGSWRHKKTYLNYFSPYTSIFKVFSVQTTFIYDFSSFFMKTTAPHPTDLRHWSFTGQKLYGLICITRKDGR